MVGLEELEIYFDTREYVKEGGYYKVKIKPNKNGDTVFITPHELSRLQYEKECGI